MTIPRTLGHLDIDSWCKDDMDRALFLCLLGHRGLVNLVYSSAVFGESGVGKERERSWKWKVCSMQSLCDERNLVMIVI